MEVPIPTRDKPSLLVIDIGKTNCKLSLLDANGAVKIKLITSNPVSEAGLYPAFATDDLWAWILAGLVEIAKLEVINFICVATHGAAAALVNPKLSDSGLALPILDYEWDGVCEFDAEYENIRPNFTETFSPGLSAGLNLGRQLCWQSRKYPTRFRSAKYILPLAQYWSWRLSGMATCEVSALGSHTDLWDPVRKTWSSMVSCLNWQDKFAPFSPAWWPIGTILPRLAEQTGISIDCQILTGVHDSNAGYARFLNLQSNEKSTLVSTGTWVVTMSPKSNVSELDPARDMLANVDVTGNPIACARFMGGREYEKICELSKSDLDGAISLEDIAALITDGIFAIGDFSDGSGPMANQASRLIGQAGNGRALATMTAALMIDLELDLLNATGSIVIEGNFARNSILCELVAALRPKQKIRKLLNPDGIAQGCFRLLHWQNKKMKGPKQLDCKPLRLDQLDQYREQWRELTHENPVTQNA